MACLARSPMSPRPTRVRWLLIFWMFVISAIAYLDRVNISVAGTSISHEYGFDQVRLGWVLSAFSWGYAFSQAPGGRLADRFGPRRVLLFGTIWWAIFTALTAAVPTQFAFAIASLVFVRFLLGVGEAVVYPGSNRLVASWIPDRERGIANGLIFAGVGAGAGMAPPLIAYVLLHWGWRWSFWISALLGLAGGLVWFLIARDRPEEHPAVNAEEAALIRDGLPKTATQSSKPVAWGAIFTSKEVALVTASYFCYCYVAYIFFTWFFIYLNAVRGLNLKTSSYYSMLPFIAMAVCSSLGGWISDRVTTAVGKRAGRCGVAGVAMVLCTVFLALAMFAGDARVASVVLAGGAGALYLSQSSFWSVSSEMAGTSSGSVSGVMNMGGQIAGGITAIMTPLIAKHFGWNTPFFVAAGLCCLGALFWLWVDIDRGAAGLSRTDRAKPLAQS
jgi:ACS family glucarate transporter-like MFS transporter